MNEIWEYVVFTVYMFLESSLIVPLPPGVIGVFVAASELIDGIPSYFLFVSAFLIGTTLGNFLAFILARRYGRDVFEWLSSYIPLIGNMLEITENFWDKRGPESVFWTRLIPFLRIYIPVIAGIAQMDIRKYLKWATAGNLIFAFVYIWFVWQGSDLINQYRFSDGSGETFLLETVLLGVLVVSSLILRRHAGIRWIV